MGKLLQLEFRRLFRAKSFYICLAISLVLVLITTGTTKLLLTLASKMVEEDPEFGEAQAAITLAGIASPTALSMLKQVASSSLTTVLAVFIPLFVTEDYTSDTIKNIYSKGYSRDEIFCSKFISAFTAGLIMIVANALFSFAMGAAFFGKIGTMGKNYVPSLIALLLLLICHVAISFSISISLRKTGGAIALAIIAPMVIGLLFLLVDAVPAFDKWDLSQYWLDSRISAMAQDQVAGKDLLSAFLVGGIVFLIAGGVGFFVNRKREG